jgi:quercetin dioxygenase-like cupin family protein
MEIRRFGPGHRRPEGPPGSQGMTGQVIHSDARAIIAELAFGPRAMIAPHSNPNTTYFIVISGGGWVQVGEERSRVNHGEAVLWPPDVVHGAYTDGSEMRAIVVEMTGADDAWARGILEGVASRQLEGGQTVAGAGGEATSPEGSAFPGPPERARGALADRAPAEGETGTGEPW